MVNEKKLAKLLFLRKKKCLTFDQIGEDQNISGPVARYHILRANPKLKKVKLKQVKKRKKYEVTKGLRSDPKSIEKIKTMRRSKKTLQQIGDSMKPPVSRERIRQILQLEAPELLEKEYKSK